MNAFTFVLQWLELMEIGSQQSDEKLEEVLKNIAINECCTLVYTVRQTYGKIKPMSKLYFNCSRVQWVTQRLSC